MAPNESIASFGGKILPQILATVSAMIYAISMGFSFGWPSPSLAKLQSNESEIPVTSEQGAMIVSILGAGSVVGCSLSYGLIDRIGRRPMLLLGSIPSLVGTVFSTFAESYWWFYVARAASGVAVGIGFLGLPMYVGEISDDRIRGALAGSIGGSVYCGSLFAYCTGPWLDWQIFNGFGALLPLIFVSTFVWMPESPHFLVMRKKTDEARKSLTWLAGSSNVEDKLKFIEEQVERERNNSGSFKDLVTIPVNRRAVVIATVLMMGQQFSGLIVVLSYPSLIFEASGVGMDPNISTIVTGLVQAISSVLATVIVDWVGRRILLLTSTLGLIIFLAGEALFFQLDHLDVDTSSLFWLPVSAFVGCSICLSFGVGLVPSVVISEIFACNVKAKATMIATIVGAISGFLVTHVYGALSEAHGIHAAFWFFVVVNACLLAYAYFELPETRKKSFVEIQNELSKVTESTTILCPRGR